MRLFDGLNYRQWQKRNSSLFTQLDKSEQQKLREQGYFNVSWLKVRYSWELLQKLQTTDISSLFEHRLRKGDLQGALAHSLREAEEAQELANDAIKDLKQDRKKINQIANRSKKISKKLLL